MAKPAVITSEDSILNLIGKYFPLQHSALVLGRGDDCALFRTRSGSSVSTDLFIEDVHFRRRYFTPAEIGHKALACNISDLAACGTRPEAFTLSIGLPPDTDYAWLDAFFSGMGALAERFGLALAGGDTTRSEKLVISITVFGSEIGEGSFLTRGGSMPGDVLFVVGPLGLARVGLQELEAHGREALKTWPQACRAHLMPEPLVDAGLMLARAGLNSRPPALMDVSDGVARDLPRLLGLTGEAGTPSVAGGGLGAELVLPAGILPSEVTRWCRENGRSPVKEALLGGEDYALLGSCAADMLPSLHAAIPGLWEIGTVTGTGKIYCNRESLESLHGFDHFAAER